MLLVDGGINVLDVNVVLALYIELSELCEE